MTCVDILTYGALTHRGAVKSANEDAVLALSPVFVVADGVSGSAGGQVASRLITDGFAELALQAPVTSDQVVQTLEACHRAVRAAQERDHHDAASTACGAVGLSVGDQAYWMIFNVGDSRVYRFTGEPWEFTQISVDHSLVQEMVDAGQLTPEQARKHPDRNVVTRAVGAEDPFEPDFWLVPMVAGDRLLLCSDGLLREAALSRVEQILRTTEDPIEAVDQCLALALSLGARDNVSVIVVDVGSPAEDADLTRARVRGSEELTVAISENGS